MGLFGKNTSKQIEKMEDELMDLQADINIGAKKIQQEERKARDLLKKAIGAPAHEKKMIATQARSLYSSARAQTKILNFRNAAYSIGMEIKTQLEVQELESDGALKAIKKVMGAKNMKDLERAIVDINKDNEKTGSRLGSMMERIENMQESYSGPELDDKALMGIISEMESMPPEQVDATLNTRLKAGESTGA